MLLLAGLIMIKPKTPGLDFLMYPFTNLPGHVTSQEKAVRFLSHPDPASVFEPPLWQKPPPPNPFPPTTATEDTSATLPPHIKSAGTFRLHHDVTRPRNPMLSKRGAPGVELLPYRVLSADVLLEGVGWVEVVVQVRGESLRREVVPEVEVFVPLGKGIGVRRPMGVDMVLGHM